MAWGVSIIYFIFIIISVHQIFDNNKYINT